MLYVKRKNWTVFIMSKVIREKKKITTYKTGQAESLPLFFEKRPYQGASGKVYPIPYVPKIEDDKIDKEYEEIILENKYIRVELLPEIGGKINRAFDKFSNYDFIYYNKVIKPAMVGLAGPWVSGGIEFNWPQHHRPTTFMKVDVTTGQNERESWAYLGEIDYFYNMKAMAKICVDDEHSYIKLKLPSIIVRLKHILLCGGLLLFRGHVRTTLTDAVIPTKWGFSILHLMFMQ